MAYVTLICAYELCAKPFPVLPYQAKTWKYCTTACYHAARTSNTLTMFARRFWTKVDKTPGHGPQGTCWLWTGATHANGYGNFRATPYKEGNMSAHIVSWFLKTGAWPPEGLFVLHSCDVRRCVNNEVCLFLGTHTDNMQDMISKGRQGYLIHPERVLRGDQHPARLHPERMARGDRNGMRLHPESVLRGEKNARSKLTDAQWAELLALWNTGEWSQRALGKRFGITSVRVGQKLRAHKQSSC